METIKWSGYEWLLQERWGLIHPQKPTWWYDSSKVSVDPHNYLHLKTGLSPRYFPELDLTSNIGAGLVSCTTPFSYGTFEIVAKLPYGKSLWPAFWMWSFNSWPPEIDVLEGFSDVSEDFSFKKKSLVEKLMNVFFKRGRIEKYNVHANVHYYDEDVKCNVSFSPDDKINGLLSYHDLGITVNPFLTAKDPTLDFITYTCVWTPSSIQIYYDGKVILNIQINTSMESLKSVSAFKGHTLNVILNNGVTSFADTKNPPESDFVIKSFKYTPL